MKQIHCPTEEEFIKQGEKLRKLGYKHPNGGDLTNGLCSYEYQRGSRYINIYSNTKKVKFAGKPVNNKIKNKSLV